MNGDEKIAALWRLLDDIDTMDDACRDDDSLFRRSAYELQRKRFDIVSGEEFDRMTDLHRNGQGRNGE